MIILPIKHENMEARRWPMVTLALIAINTIVFLLTTFTANDEKPELAELRTDIRILAALHPELKMQPEAQQLVDSYRQSHPSEWKRIQNPYRDIISPYDAKVKLMDDPAQLQGEMDRMTSEYLKMSSASVVEQYAFVPAHPSLISYLTANFLHGGWMHLIGNMWFLWLAGFVLEDVWGRWLYSAFYLIAGAAALQIHAWANVGSVIPSIGASGAVAALMGAFLVRYPKMKIEMVWVLWLSFTKLARTGNPFRYVRFKAAAYWLLPLWLAIEILEGTLFGSASGVAHWAHVGGFAFGALAALAIQYSGLEHKANKAIEQEIGWNNDSDLQQASDMMEHGQLAEAQTLLTSHVATQPIHWTHGLSCAKSIRDKTIPSLISRPRFRPAACTCGRIRSRPPSRITPNSSMEGARKCPPPPGLNSAKVRRKCRNLIAPFRNTRSSQKLIPASASR